jgi:hydroxypyruvate isomerase
MDRRQFLTSGLVAGAAAFSVSSTTKAEEKMNSNQTEPFKLKYAPYFGMFKHHAGDDLIDQIKFMHDQGFRAIFDNGLMGKSHAEQEAIAKTLDQLGMDLGPFVSYADFGVKSFVTSDPEIRTMLINKTKEAVEVAKRVNAKWTLMVPGHYDDHLEWDYQTANVVENLRYCSEICEASGLVIVLEPLNAWTDHPGLFLTKIPQAYQICCAVNSPSCKIINDLYHQQITEGNLIPNIEMAWSEIAAFHLGDNPGRKEPTTGEINYRNIFKHLYEKGYQGVLCMEHGMSKEGKEGEVALLEAYRYCDNF